MRIQTSHELFIIIRIFALHNLLQKSSRDAFFSITFSCTESRSKDHCSVLLVISHSALFWITDVFLFLFILFQTSNLTSYSPLVLLFYSAGPHRSLSVAFEWFYTILWVGVCTQTELAWAKYKRVFLGRPPEGKASWGAHGRGLQLHRGRVGLRCYGDSETAVFKYHLPYAIWYSVVSLDLFVSLPVDLLETAIQCSWYEAFQFHIQYCLESRKCIKHRNAFERSHYACSEMKECLLPPLSCTITCQNYTALKYIITLCSWQKGNPHFHIRNMYGVKLHLYSSFCWFPALRIIITLKRGKYGWIK